MCLAQEPQRSEACDARTRGLSVSSQALFHWATAHPALKSISISSEIHAVLLIYKCVYYNSSSLYVGNYF